MPRITRKLEWDSGHRVYGHEGKCRWLHGHRYVAEVTVDAMGLDDLGRVIDFGIVKDIVGKWIDDNWDHRMLLNSDDPASQVPVIADDKPFLFYKKNPTAENIAEALYQAAASALLTFGSITVKKVRVYETPNCWAEYPNE